MEERASQSLVTMLVRANLPRYLTSDHSQVENFNRSCSLMPVNSYVHCLLLHKSNSLSKAFAQHLQISLHTAS